MATASPLTTTHGLSRGSTTDLIYVVAGPEYWDSIPQTRQLTCGRVRFTTERIAPPLGAGTFLLKQQAMLALKEGDEIVINGQKWWTSGAGDPRCAVYIFMGKTDPSAAAKG